MAEKNSQNKKQEEPTPKKGHSLLAVWSVPVASSPIVRIDLKAKFIQVKEVFKIVCDALGMYEDSRKFFALFRGVLYPLKKYGNEESILLPYKATLTIQKWCFDVTAERIAIKTDEVAYRLIANQTIAEIEDGKLQLTDEELEPLKQFYKGQFMCYKQFVEEARELPWYCTLRCQNVEVVNKASFVSASIEAGTKLDVIASHKKLYLISDSIELGIPWRKIRRFTEKKDKKTISLEIFLADDKSFTWIELSTPQFTFFLQAIAECIDMLQARLEKPAFAQPKFVQNKKRNKLSWGLVKAELFGIGKNKEEVFATFDSFDNAESESDENDSFRTDDEYDDE